MRIRTFLSILVIFLTVQLNARPVRPEIRTFTQPDGSTFHARCYGDEFLKINTTAQGHAIVRDSEGWWCYAIYENDGSRESSGYRVGHDAPYDVLSRSMEIPHEVLAFNAQRKRAPFMQEGEGILKRVRKAQGATLQSQTAITKHGIVILAQYSDAKFEHGRQEFVDMLTSQGYRVNGATGSAKEYFDNQFGGMFEFDFQVSEIVTLSKTRSYYGQNDRYGYDLRPAEMVEEACRLAHEAGINFAQFDDDSDGYVDNVFVLYAGEDEADDPDKSADCIWSHQWYIYSGGGIVLELDGKLIDQYACTSELMASGSITGIGTFCHEFAHTLGLPDLYDTDYYDSGGYAAGMWNSTSLMDGGNSNNNYNTPPYFNAIEREILGLSEPIILERNGSYTLQPIHKGGQYYKITCNTATEYYLLECRAKDGWDTYVGGTGMLVYHVDKSKPTVWNNNTVNAKLSHQYADLIEADRRSDKITEFNYNQLWNISGIFFPYASVTSISYDTDPGFTFWYGSKTKAVLTDITRSGDNVTFMVSGLKGETPPAVANLQVETFMDAAILSFESDRPYEGEAKIAWGLEGEEDEFISIQPYETGKYAVTIEGLTPQKTYSAIVSFESDGVAGPEKKKSFMTSRAAPIEWAYIYIGKNAKEDGTYTSGTKIPLRVYNAATAEEIEWYFKEEEISPAGDGYFTIQETGVLRAMVYWPDGETDILEKHIILSE